MNLLNAPPRLSDLAPDALRRALNGRHHMNRVNWLREHERAGMTFGQRIAHKLRRVA